MSTGSLISLGGMALEAVGIIVTGRGFLVTWREYSGGEGLILDSPPARWLRRLLRRASREAAAEASTAHGYGTGYSIRPGRSYSTLTGYKPSEAIRALDLRTQEIARNLGAEENVRVKADAEIRTQLDKVAGRASESAETLEKRTQHVAVGGLRIAFAGLVLVFFGLVGQALGVMIGQS